MSSLTVDISHTRFFKDVSERERRIARLEQLKEMLDEGLITQANFDLRIKSLKEKGLI